MKLQPNSATNSAQSDIEESRHLDSSQQGRLSRLGSQDRSQSNLQLNHNHHLNKDKVNLDIPLNNQDSEDKVLTGSKVSANRNTPKQRITNSLIKQVRILTYNIFLRPPPIKNNKDDYKNERTKLFLNSITDFDIICFQELFGFLNQRKHKIIFNGMKQGFFHHASSPSPSFFSSYLVDGGLVTISRFPIVEKIYKPYKYGVLSDNLSQKGVLYTKIQINDSYVHLFNTHLQASYVGAENNVKATVITRIDQIIMMRNFIVDCVKKFRDSESDLIMICGDFNVNARPDSYPIHFLNDVPDIQNVMKLVDPNKFSEYDVLKYILSDGDKIQFIDTLRIKFKGESPVTYADTYLDKDTNQEFPLEEALTIKEDLLQKTCLDYIIQLKLPIEKSDCLKIDIKQEEEEDEKAVEDIKKRKSVSQTISNGFKIDFEQVFVEKFFVTNQPFTQLSDHYGVSASFRYTLAEQQQNKQNVGFKESVISSHSNKLNQSQINQVFD